MPFDTNLAYQRYAFDTPPDTRVFPSLTPLIRFIYIFVIQGIYIRDNAEFLTSSLKLLSIIGTPYSQKKRIKRINPVCDGKTMRIKARCLDTLDTPKTKFPVFSVQNIGKIHFLLTPILSGVTWIFTFQSQKILLIPYGGIKNLTSLISADGLATIAQRWRLTW